MKKEWKLVVTDAGREKTFKGDDWYFSGSAPILIFNGYEGEVVVSPSQPYYLK